MVKNGFFKKLCVLMVLFLCFTSFVSLNACSKEGNQFADVFDANYYATTNKDVALLCGSDEKALLNHFINYGMKEGRKGNQEFDVIAYKTRYKDLQEAFGDDLTKYYMHYLTRGKTEGRNASADGLVTVNDEETAKSALNATDNETNSKPDNNKKTKYEEYPQAVAVLNKVGWKLENAFKWSSSLTYYGHGAPGMPAEPSPGVKWFADFGFTNHKGNCYVMAATFYEMAKCLGYSPRQMSGLVPSRKRGLTPHSWVEIDVNGQTYVFDPDYTYGTGKNGFMIQYGQKGTWRYQSYSVMSE
ncbi:transglutaminase domain-containing protein [Butyrivibrio sp. NC3005]|uniref:transglutaminase domain-containing protein n=1 Tax=Butyrivibrio sp. NC3005 TaxID=1280685 RepID=UPI0003F8ABA3|nr:transglutaminase domain-containing protein [Butyrivibrio sp. NC3005]